jgi:hypothetical protein
MTSDENKNKNEATYNALFRLIGNESPADRLMCPKISGNLKDFYSKQPNKNKEQVYVKRAKRTRNPVPLDEDDYVLFDMPEKK